MAPHSSTLAWKIPGMGEPGELQSVEPAHAWAAWFSGEDPLKSLHGDSSDNYMQKEGGAEGLLRLGGKGGARILPARKTEVADRALLKQSTTQQ